MVPAPRPVVRCTAVVREANIIVSAYASTSFMTGPGLRLFNEETIFVEVPITLEPGEALADKAFGRTVNSLKDWTDGSVLRGLFRRIGALKDVYPKSIAVISFSAGTTFAKAVLGGADRNYVDTVICLDGLHIPRLYDGTPAPSVLKPWLWFGERAAFDERLLVIADTDIVPYNHDIITSTSESAELVMQGVEETLAPSAPIQSPSYMGFGQAANSGAITWEAIGNLWRLEYGGTQAADHVRMAQVASEAIWKTFLVPRWNAGVTCRAPDLAVSGLGAAADCEPNRVVVPEGMYQFQFMRDVALPAVVSGAIFGGTYWVGSQIGKMIG